MVWNQVHPAIRMTDSNRRRNLQTGGPGKLALLLSLTALVLALIPKMQEKELSGAEKWLHDLQTAAGNLQRHALEDSRFTLDFQGPGKWESFGLLAAIAGLVLGAVSIGQERIAGGLAALIGLAVGAWIYLGLGG